MGWRVFQFLLFQSLGAGIGFTVWPWPARTPGAFVGVVLGGVAWVLLDVARGVSLLHWLRQGEPAQSPELSGLWGEVAARARSLLNARQQQLQLSENRLTEFLTAIVVNVGSREAELSEGERGTETDMERGRERFH